MSKEKHCEIIDALCKSLGIEDSQSRYETCNVEVNGVAFTLTHGSPVDPSSMFVYCDFGEPPPDLKEQALLRILETNSFLYGNNAPSFAINPDTGRVVFMLPAPLEKLTHLSLVAIMANVGGYIQDWRKTFFLTEGERDEIARLQFLQSQLAA